MISATLSCISLEAANRETDNDKTSIERSLNILNRIFLIKKVCQLVKLSGAKLVHLDNIDFHCLSRKDKSSGAPYSAGIKPFLNILMFFGPFNLNVSFSSISNVPSRNPAT